MVGIIFAMLTLIGWGSGDVFGTISARRAGAFTTIVWMYFLALLLFLPLIPSHMFEFAKFTPATLILTFALGVIIVFGNLVYTKALQIGNPSLVGTISGAAYSFIPVLSILFLKETLSAIQAMCIVVIFFGIVLASLDITAVLKHKKQSSKATVLSLITLICWAIGFTFIKIPTRQVGWFWPNYFTYTAVIFVLLFSKVKKVKLQNMFAKHAFILVVIAALLIHGADFTYNAGIYNGLVSVVAPIAGTYPVLFAMISYFVFREPLKKHQLLGIIITLVGIVALSFLSR